MAKNSNLHEAKANKKDEFYTQLSDIEKELANYNKKDFKDKVVYCNCDDPLESNFFKYFFLNFKRLELKELITTCYKSQNYKEISKEQSPKKSYALRICRAEAESALNNSGGGVEPHSIKSHPLERIESLLALTLTKAKNQSQKTQKAFENNKQKLESCTQELTPDRYCHTTGVLFVSEDFGEGNAGDFRSRDCIELLKQSDIVVTNPPFSLFREYVAQLIHYDKKFLIIGNVNAITYKEIFRLIKANKLWLGASIKSGDREFGVPPHYPLNAAGVRIDEYGNRFLRIKGVRWFVNLDYKKRHELLETIYSYAKTPEKYPKYDNYDAINVDKTNQIPLDYEGVMGVPITFLDKHNPKQFEIVGKMSTTGIDEFNFGYPYINGKKIYARILIRRIPSAQDNQKELQLN
ncbi:modification methylase [Campylobacter sp. MIT 21-1685]|uniref:adenine-specific methyltransferase EcoRI family protein n=1 Tax=unclassified Campylobacter TaxID=2593542 RepID=UPI00224AC13D|nr:MULTISPECIES: adenine-specific methyltransferase EcoRI family protein [unclassified Campylobacter]MCX2682515.1 modification methylase [Campylobacter sp. MIT 21-1684]MCX2750772.1 modification methylase [Campylobacter sp. MIT 21-1682]MCX2806996.1 modification methylase [Campylobacter sp. MIT 21-1685]